MLFKNIIPAPKRFISLLFCLTNLNQRLAYGGNSKNIIF